MIRKPRCFLVYALASPKCSPSEANRLFNAYVADPIRGLILYHDHFIGEPGGVAVFFVETPEQREAIMAAGSLVGWKIDVRPLIFAHSPAAFDEQIRYTLKAYRNEEWETLRMERRPAYGDPRTEAETGEEQ